MKKVSDYLSPDLIELIKVARLGDYKGAIKYSKAIFHAYKNNPLYLNTLGIIYRRAKHYKKARSFSEKALSLDKTLVQAKLNIASIDIEDGYIDRAIDSLENILEKNKHYSEAITNLAYAFKKKGDYNNSQKYYEKALDLPKKLPRVYFNLGTVLLSIQKFKEGWEKYEYRWQVDPGDKVIWPLKKTPMWEGQKDKGVFLWREQGIGDDIIFLGLVPEAYEKAGKGMTVLIDPRLVAICKRSMPGIDFLPAAKGSVPEDRFDYQLPMGSLPRLFRNSEEDFYRTRKSYLKAEMARVEKLRKELGVEGRKVIGISWKSFKSLNTTKKSMDLAQFGNMFKGLDVTLVNLQYGEVDEEIREFTKSTGIEVLQSSSVDLREDLDGLAALIELCDLVVSTSNVTIHMAGALGKDSWVLLPFAASFWWLIERTDSLWYPTVRLYRQKSLQDWSEVLKVIRLDLDQRFDNQ